MNKSFIILLYLTFYCEWLLVKGCLDESDKLYNLKKSNVKVTRYEIDKDVGLFHQVNEQAKNICKLPIQKGSCEFCIVNYFFNSTSQKCQKFHYSGCKGNMNNFRNLKTCQQMCIPKKNYCYLPAKIGPCRASLKRFFFNSTSEKCEQFIYGGCQANKNNFMSRSICENTCDQNMKTICNLTVDEGSGSYRSTKWFYNSRSEKCEKFCYTGNGGNGNNFNYENQCTILCGENKGKEKNICYLPVKRGDCKAMLTRYFFDLSTGNCEQFNYGGCNGNENNFMAKQDCEVKCPPTH